ncbi:MAG: adenylate kinase [Sedimentisphaerales bacterium]|nr:adenylate kinase [Sedimentisphaerales bacterium]
MIVVFLGPPGAGKGTQCKLIVDRYGLTHLSSGDILRRERKENTELGQKAQSYMDSGQLVPDDLIVAMMMKEIGSQSSGGYVLDGFPRTIGQAQELDKALVAAGKKVDVVLNLEVDDNKLETRITGRRSCGKCGTAYHVTFNPPKTEDQCDKGCGALTQRPDDTSEVVQQRIKTYHEQTSPLVEYYQQQGNVKNVNGNLDIQEVTKALYDVLDGVKTSA